MICTNVPGPQMPLYLLGHKLLRCYPYVPIGGELGVNVAILSYNGTAYVGFGGDVFAVPDIDRFEEMLRESFARIARGCGCKPVEPQRRCVLKRQPATRRPRNPAKVKNGQRAHDAARPNTQRMRVLHRQVGNGRPRQKRQPRTAKVDVPSSLPQPADVCDRAEPRFPEAARLDGD